MCTDSATDGNRRRYRVGHRRHILGDLEACVITVVNHSQRVSNSDVALMTRACASQLWWHAAPAWGRTPTPVIYAVDEKSAPPGSQVIGIFDTPDQPGVLGWHTEDANGVIYGRVFAGVVLDHGGTVMTGQLSVSAVLSHECLEAFIDPNCNLWIDVDGRRSIALEACLAAGVRIPLVAGGSAPIEVLADRGGEFSVWSSDNGRVVPARATAHATGWRPVVKVRLRDGSAFRCTPDHLLLRDDGVYVRADSLVSDDGLLPSSPATDSANSGGTDRVLDCEGGSRLFAQADRDDGRFGRLGLSVALPVEPAVPSHPAFAAGIEHVDEVRPDEEMVRSDARGGIAFVAQFQARRDYSASPLPRQVRGSKKFLAFSDLSVARVGRRSGPQPAPVARLFVDSGPESVLQRGGPRVVGVVSGGSVDRSAAVHAGPVGAAQSFGSVESLASGYGAGFRDGVAYPGVDGSARAHPGVVQGAQALADAPAPVASGYLALAHAKIIDSVEPDGYSGVYDLTVPRYHNYAIDAGVFVHNCDPVEADSYALSIDNKSVAVSNFITSKWADPAARGGFDHMNRCTAPFTMTRGGYLLKMADGVVSQVFAAEYPEWKKSMKESPLARTSRRLAVA